MSRVLLFVQTGEGRPKCVGPLLSGGGLVSMGYHQRRTYKTAIEGWWLSPGKQGEVDRADRWWLVECDNADEGRRCIANALAGEVRTVERPDQPPRILASGGQSDD